MTLAAATSGFVNEQDELTPVAPGVYSFIVPESDSGVVQGNCTLIVGEDAALVVDSGQFPSLARRMVADIQKLTQKPVRYLVNTHWHFDHGATIPCGGVDSAASSTRPSNARIRKATGNLEPEGDE